MEKDKRIIALFLDFKTIYREINLDRLYMYGIRETELEWFKSYMKRRRQTTKLNDIESDEIINNFGVPHGSILGALLFIIYINDMRSILEKCKVVLYTDDTLLYTIANSDEEYRENIRYDMKKIDEWFKMNKLKLNENKTKIMERNVNSDEISKIKCIVIEKV